MSVLIRSDIEPVPHMSADAARRFAETAQKWRNLIDRRCAQLVELQRTGAWRHYYNEAEFLAVMSEALALTQTWRQLAPRPADSAAPPDETAV
jgi:uncharacterized repeat protein (TIGR03809 family)